MAGCGCCGLLDSLGGDVVSLVVGQLLLAAAVGLVDGLLHALGDAVGIHDDPSVEVSRGPAHRLGERPVRAQESLLVGIEYGHKRYLGQVEPLAQQVHADEHIVDAGPQVVENADAVEGVDVGVYVVAVDVEFGQVAVQLLGHAFGQGGDQHPLVALDALLYLLEQVVYLVEAGPHLDDRVEQTGGPDDLLYHHALALLELVVGRGGAYVDNLPGQTLELVELQRPVIHGSRQAEPVLHQIHLARTVAPVHGPDLRHGHVALVDDGEKILGEIVEQAEGAGTRFAAVEVARVVLDARAVAYLANHLHVVGHPLVEPLGLELLPDRFEKLHLLAQVYLYLADGLVDALFGRHEQVGREYLVGIEGACAAARSRVDGAYRLNLLAPELDAHDGVVVGQVDVDRVAFHPEVAPVELHLVARVERVDQMSQQPVAPDVVAHLHLDHVAVEVLGVADAVEARHRRDHNHILAPRQQGRGGGEPQAVYLFVDGKVFLDIGIGRGDIGLGLVVVVVGDEILDGILGEEPLELVV